MALDLIAVSSNGGNAQNPTCPVPTGAAAGDLLVMTVATGAAVHTSPAGWTDEVQIGTSSEITYVVFKIAAAGDLGGTITFSQGGTTPTRIAIRAYRASGSDAIDTSNPIDVTSFISTGSSASITSPSTTAPAAGWLVEGATVRGATSYSSSPPAGFIEEIDTTTSSGSPAKAQTSMFKGTGTTLSLLTTGDSMGGHTFTAATSVATGEQHAYTLFIRKFVTTPTAVTMTADPSLVADLPGPLKAGIYNPAVVMYLSHRGGANILPAETMDAYLDPVNDHHGWEGDAYLLQNSGSDTDDDRLADVHDTDMASVPLYTSTGAVVTAGSDVTTTSITTWDNNIYQKNPIDNTLHHVARWRHVFEGARQSTGGGFWPYGRFFAIENKAAGTTTPIINSLKARGLVHFALADTFDYTRCTTLAAAGLHVMWLTTSFATNSAASAKAAGIEWVGWQAGTSGFAAFLAAAHAAGLYVNVYDVQTASQRDSYTAQGVEMISTDRPDLVYPSAAWTTSAAIAGTAAVTASIVLGRSGSATISETDSVTSTATRGAVGSASISEAATVTATGVRGMSSGATVTGTDSVDSAVVRGAAGDSAITAADSVAASASSGQAVGASVTGTDTVAADTVRGRSADASLAETGNVTAAASQGQGAAATITGTAATSTTGVRGQSGDASITATVAVTSTAAVSSASGSDAEITGTVAVNSTAALAKTAGATIAETTVVVSSGVRGRVGDAVLVFTGAIAANGLAGRVGDTAVSGVASVASAAVVGRSSGTTVEGTAAVEASIIVTTGVPEATGRILRARLAIPTAHAHLAIDRGTGELTIPTARGVLR